MQGVGSEFGARLSAGFAYTSEGLAAISRLCLSGFTRYAEWVARHTIEIGTREQIVYLVMDMADWVRASQARDTFVSRQFHPSMSLQTVRNLSREWHEAVANDQDWAGAPFPPPWYPVSKTYGVEIVPIESRAELYREGHAMHHCVGSYADRVYTGELYIFGIRHGREACHYRAEQDS